MTVAIWVGPVWEDLFRTRTAHLQVDRKCRKAMEEAQSLAARQEGVADTSKDFIWAAN